MNKHRVYEMSRALSFASIPIDSFWSFVTISHGITFLGALCFLQTFCVRACVHSLFCSLSIACCCFFSLSTCVRMYHVAWHLNFSYCAFRTLITSPKLWIKSSNKFFHPKDSIHLLWIGFTTFYLHFFIFLLRWNFAFNLLRFARKIAFRFKPLLFQYYFILYTLRTH